MGIVIIVIGLAIAAKLGIGLFIYRQMKKEDQRKAERMESQQ